MGKVDDHVLELATQEANSFISETLMLVVVIFATSVMLYPIIISLSEEGFAAMHTHVLLGVEIIAKFNWLKSARRGACRLPHSVLTNTFERR